jgi:nephrocystin-3
MSDSRRIRVFISSTFRDMVEERNELMTHTWPELRRFCQGRHVELVEVDLRWGIAESQSTRRETLKLCLDEIRSCRPFFIGLLGERYGWTPGDDAFTADLKEEQPWLKDLHGKSVTELEIFHGVLNNPDMAGRAFFYFRDPVYSKDRGADFAAEGAEAGNKQFALKTHIRKTCAAKKIPLRENYPDPRKLADLVIEDLKSAIEAQFPMESIPDALTREALDHAAFAEIRRRTYIGRAEYFEALDNHAAADGGPLLLLGDSGSGKSALLANWVAHWREDHPHDFIVQHYIGGTADSADHWRLMTRLMAEIKRWSNDSEALPTNHDDMLKDFPLWLAKGRVRAAHEGVRFILVLDALNQLDDQDHARLLGWLPEHPFTGPLRLIVSTLQGKPGADDPLEVIRKRRWQELRIQPLTVEERQRMIADYLARFGKKIDVDRLERLASAEPAANPLYLKILLDELRVTGTHDRLDERITEYLVAADIPSLLQQVLARYRRDYERDRKGLVAEALGLIYAARRGLSETELLQLLRPADQMQLPPALWTPLRAALEDSLVDRGGILNFAHDFLRIAVGSTFAADKDRRKTLCLQLADYFEAQPVTVRSCDELPWLLRQAEDRERLRVCLLDMERFLVIRNRDQEELLRYWVWLGEERAMGQRYMDSFNGWSGNRNHAVELITHVANDLAMYLNAAALFNEAESLLRHALDLDKSISSSNHQDILRDMMNLAWVLQAAGRHEHAETILQEALAIAEQSCGPNHDTTREILARMAILLVFTSRSAAAEPLMRRVVSISENSGGLPLPHYLCDLNNLARTLKAMNRFAEAEQVYRRALDYSKQAEIDENYDSVALILSNLACLLYEKGSIDEAEFLFRRALELAKNTYGNSHTEVAIAVVNYGKFLEVVGQLEESEKQYREALRIDEECLGPYNPEVAIDLNHLSRLLRKLHRFEEAEAVAQRAIAIDELSSGHDR